MSCNDHTTNSQATSVACLNCREKHLKCDGNPDGCGRCRALSIYCHFVPSRRGRRGQLTENVSPYNIPISDAPQFLTEDLQSPAINIDDLAPVYVPESSRPLPRINTQLMRIFYEYFHPAHPIFPPLDIWMMGSPPQFLVDVVECIALHYLSPGQVPELSHDLWSDIGKADLGLERVQAYLLLGIVFHGRKDPARAKEAVGLAIQCAFNFGLHSRELSESMELQSPVRAESMRRTLWEIFVVDTLLAAVQVGGSLQFFIETPDVPLPSDDGHFVDSDYRAPSISARDLAFRAFSGDDRLSSLAYRVAATLIFRQCIIACETHADEDTVEALDSMISAWFHRWPADKSAVLQPNGKVNQIDFQSVMIMHCASIYLHFSRSSFVPFLPDTGEIFCSRPPPALSPSPSHQMHTAKITNAAVELSKLASLSTAVVGHSPFFACTLVLSTIIQLTVLSAPLGQSTAKYSAHLALNLGVLKSMGGVWTISAASLEKLRAITREIQLASTSLFISLGF